MHGPYKPMEFAANRQKHKANGLLDSKGKDDRDSLVDMSKHVNSYIIIAKLTHVRLKGNVLTWNLQ